MNVGILLFDEVEVLDFAGPFEAFAVTTDQTNHKVFNVFTVAEKTEISARNGLIVQSKYLLENAPHIDILIIPGGYGAETVELHNEKLKQWIKQRYQSSKITLSVCTGAFILAETGLLNGLSATTHWMDLQRFEEDYPQINVIKNVRYVDQGRLISSAGISSGIHASLYTISKLVNREIAMDTAKRMEFDTHFD